MTFNNAAWAIDVAFTGSDLARRAEYAAVADAEGVVLRGDLKVTALGVGVVPSKYHSVVNETLVVAIDSVHTRPSREMPGANVAAKPFIVAVVVGVKAFSQAGHPFLLSAAPRAGEEATFKYVCPML